MSNNNNKPILYWNLGSQPARAVKALLDIGKIPHELVTKDVVKQQTRSKQYLQMNPLGQIPFLIHNSLKIGQSNAILIYLCQKYPSHIPSHFYGSSPQHRALSNQYLSWYQYYFRPALFKIIKLKIYGFIRKGQSFKQYQLNSARKQMFQAIKTFDMLLQKNIKKFIINDQPNIADLLIFFQLTNVYYYEENIDEFKNVAKWFENVYNIPEVNKITHEWFPMSKQITKILKGIKAQDEEIKSKL